MDIQVAHTKFASLNNAHIPLVIINGQVDMSCASFIVQRLDSGISVRTLANDARNLKHLLLFCFNNEIDIHARIASLKPLIAGEWESFSAFCSATLQTGELVVAGTYTSRMNTAWAYIKHLWRFFAARATKAEHLQAAQIHFQQMEQSFTIYRKTPYKGSSKDRTGLPPKLRARFFSIIDPLPENENNPYKSQRIRWRNFVLFLTMILGGNRKSESLLLRLDRVQLTGKRKYYEIVKEDSLLNAYPRKQTPSVKTKGRQIELNDSLANIFEHYITKWRPKFKGANKSMYLFLSGIDGQTLSVNAPNEALKTIIEMYPEYKGHLSPHRLRHTFQDLLSESLDKKFESQGPIAKQAQKAQLQEYAGGWSPGSQMPAHYSKGAIQRSVGSLVLNIQNSILNSGQSSDE